MRKIIFECLVGSHLYGTNTEKSDLDYCGVFLPSEQDLLGMQECPKEWDQSVKKSETVQNQQGDVDRKFYSLKRFLQLVAEGQPGQLELLFVPPDRIISASPEWCMILANKEHFLSKKGIAPFIGFALAQAHKAVIKGENLKLIRKIITWYDECVEKGFMRSTALLKDYPTFNGLLTLSISDEIELKTVTNLHGFTTVEIAGRNYDVGVKVKTFVNNLKELEARYGDRANAAAANSYDFKSLSHAYRLLNEGEEFLRTGKITLPRPAQEVEFLKKLREGGPEMEGLNHFESLTKTIDFIRQVVEAQSTLPEAANWKKINELCVLLHKSNLK